MKQKIKFLGESKVLFAVTQKVCAPSPMHASCSSSTLHGEREREGRWKMPSVGLDWRLAKKMDPIVPHYHGPHTHANE